MIRQSIAVELEASAERVADEVSRGYPSDYPRAIKSAVFAPSQ